MKKIILQFVTVALLLTPFIASSNSETKVVSVGSKNFTESYILGEMLAQIAESIPGYRAKRNFGLNDIAILARALEKEEVDIYPEYTGTITHTFIKNPTLSEIKDINKSLKPKGMEITPPLGFNNTYVMTVRRDYAEKNGLKTIDDLRKVPNAVVRTTPGFLSREDGMKGLLKAYQLKLNNMDGMEHGLLYQALANGQVDVIDGYSTTGMLVKLDAVLLEDSRSYFPKYFAVFMHRRGYLNRHPQLAEKISMLYGNIDESVMQKLNAKVDLEGKSFDQVARNFLIERGILKNQAGQTRQSTGKSLWELTWEHIQLVAISLSLACLLGVPLGIIAVRSKKFGQVLLLIAGLFQTIPSLALLCFFIPLFGIGKLPAIIALFVYSLLPILRNTYIGIYSIDKKLREVQNVLGMNAYQKIFWIELPLASPAILTGIKTSAIINIGTATLAALIGAGGLGVPIITGLSLNQIPMILTGAIPAALLAIVAHFAFELLDRLLIPKGLQKLTVRVP